MAHSTFDILGNTIIKEKIATAVASFALAVAVFSFFLKISITPTYSDFIVGLIAWNADSKLQDLIAIPTFIIVLFFGFLWISKQLTNLRLQFGPQYSTKLANHIISWSLPACAAVCGLILGPTLGKELIVISAVGIIFVMVVAVSHKLRKVNVDPEVISISLFSISLICIIPIEIALVIGRAPLHLSQGISFNISTNFIHLLTGIAVIIGLLYAIYFARRLAKLLPKALLLGQLGLTLFSFSIYPARLLQPNGILTKYLTTFWLKVLVIGIIICGATDIIHRYRKYSVEINSPAKLLSPVAIFMLLIVLLAGNTIAPQISPDDYHFGERLLGWWSYFNGTIPYIGYIPAHGVIPDDLAGFLCTIFYDGSAGSIGDASRLAIVFLSFIAFISLYVFSRSICLAFIATFFLGTFLLYGWTYLILIPFFCIWLSHSLMVRPTKWLSVWIITAPLAVLCNPPQGLPLVAASCIIAVYCCWCIRLNYKIVEYKPIIIALAILCMLALVKPIFPMLVGAVRYVIENGPINQIAYGIPWRNSLNYCTAPSCGFIFESIRMSWGIFLLWLLMLIYLSIKKYPSKEKLFSALAILLFVLLLIPYSMGRIATDSISRPGMIAVFSWTILLPFASWYFFQPANRVLLLLLITCVAATINAPYSLSLTTLVSAASPTIPTQPLKDGKNFGLPNIGQAHVEDEHWDRLIRLNKLLNSKLPAGKTYLDLTSRNAQYFYLNRKPVVPITAPYNMVPPSQQKRIVAQLKEKLPSLALLDGANIIHDGGGLALRDPYLYRLVFNNYTPKFEDGFIIGYKKTADDTKEPQTLDVAIKNFTDINWDRGINRTAPAIIIDDPTLASLLTVDTTVQIGTASYKINKIAANVNTVWFDGPILNPAAFGYPNKVKITLNPQIANEYKISLLEKSFAQTDLQKIPVAWGKSQKSLQKKMTSILKLDNLPPTFYQLTDENGYYKVNGTDPQLVFDVSSYAISGQDTGLLRFDFSCPRKTAEPRIQIFWWGDDQNWPSEIYSIRLTAADGHLIIPLDASPRWLSIKHIKGLRIDLDNASACPIFSIKNVGLFQRHLD